MSLRSALGLLLLFAGSLAAAAQPGPTIAWMVAEIPPQMIVEGELAGKGFGDQQLRELIGKLPEFHHRITIGSLARNWYEMSHRDGVCFNGVQHTPDRERFAVFTHRAIKVPTFGLVVRARGKDRFGTFLDTAGEVDLDLLGQDSTVIGAYTATRTHLPGFDRFAADPARKTVLEKIPQTGQLFSLLHAGRVDFIVAGPLEASYEMAAKHRAGEFATLPIKGYPRYNRGYIACSDGPIGRSVIERLNKLLDTAQNWAAYVEPMRRWLSPADFASTLAEEPDTE